MGRRETAVGAANTAPHSPCPRGDLSTALVDGQVTRSALSAVLPGPPSTGPTAVPYPPDLPERLPLVLLPAGGNPYSSEPPAADLRHRPAAPVGPEHAARPCAAAFPSIPGS